MRFLNASVLPRKPLNHNLSWGFPLGNLLPKTRVLKHRVLERKRRPNANASVLRTQHFRTLSGWEDSLQLASKVCCYFSYSSENFSTPNMTGRRFHRTIEVIPRCPWNSKSPCASSPIKTSISEGDARGAREVRDGTSSIPFHRVVSWSATF